MAPARGGTLRPLEVVFPGAQKQRLFLKSAAEPHRQEREIPMKLLIISALAAVALFSTVTLRSHTPAMQSSFATADVMSLQALTSAVDVSRLPIEEFEDLTLIYPTKR
jgi:hypothetical protein